MSFKLPFSVSLRANRSALTLILATAVAAACDFGASSFEIVDVGDGDGDGNLGGAGDGDTGGDGDGDGDGDTGGTSGDGDGDGDTGGMGTGGTGTGGSGMGTGGDGSGGSPPRWDCNPFGQNVDMTLFDGQQIADENWVWKAGPFLIPEGPGGAFAIGIFERPSDFPIQAVEVRVRRITDSMDNPLDPEMTPFLLEDPQGLGLNEIEQIYRSQNNQLVLVGRTDKYIREFRMDIVGNSFAAPISRDTFVECGAGFIREVRAAEGLDTPWYAVTCHDDRGTLDQMDDELALHVVEAETIAPIVSFGPGIGDLSLNIKFFTANDQGQMFLITGSDMEEAYIRRGSDIAALDIPVRLELMQGKWTSLAPFNLPGSGVFIFGAALNPDSMNPTPATPFAGLFAYEDLMSLDGTRFAQGMTPSDEINNLQNAMRITDARMAGVNILATGPTTQANSIMLQVHTRTGEVLVRKPIISTAAVYAHSSIIPLGVSSLLAYRERPSGTTDVSGKAMMVYCGPDN